jgi:hypothetical protein
MDVEEKIISGAHKSDRVTGAPLPMWATQTVFRSNMNGRSTNQRVRSQSRT